MIIICAILGDGKLFAINIDADQTVIALKTEIKKENPKTLHDSEAKDLTLYYVNIPPPEETQNDPLVQSILLQTIKFDENCELKTPLDALSTVPFPNRHLHILVRPSDTKSLADAMPQLAFRSKTRNTEHFTVDTLDELENFDLESPLDDELNTLKLDVNKEEYDEFTMPRPNTKQNTQKNTDEDTRYNRNHGDHFGNPSVSQVLSDAGYQVLHEPQLEDGWCPLYPQLPPTVCRARGPVKGTRKMILKVVEQDEFDIHSYLLELKVARKHVIPIIASFPLPHSVGRIIAMEEHLVLSDAPSDLFKAAGLRLAHQFLLGVQFIHNQSVAHLDLKPDNIVLKKHTQLYIIDFSVSVRVPGLDFQMTGYQGTEGWVAPEVEQDPDTAYSPIRADLWSSGKVLRYLVNPQDSRDNIRTLTSQLQSQKPQQRPLLSTTDLGKLFVQPRANSAKRKLGSGSGGQGRHAVRCKYI